jgi:DNA-binding NarL/FixJ family response regulator
MEQITVSIVEDVAEIRDGVRAIVDQTPGFLCISAYNNAKDAYAGLKESPPDITIMDIGLPDGSGIECIRKLKTMDIRTQFLIFTIYEAGDRVFEALAAGASGYLLKTTAPEKIMEALQDMHAGGSPMSSSIARKIVASFYHPDKENKLSAREWEILRLLARGSLYKEIAAGLFISVGTVRQHIHNIYEKLHVQNRTEAINKAFGFYNKGE